MLVLVCGGAVEGGSGGGCGDGGGEGCEGGLAILRADMKGAELTEFTTQLCLACPTMRIRFDG